MVDLDYNEDDIQSTYCVCVCFLIPSYICNIDWFKIKRAHRDMRRSRSQLGVTTILA